MEQEYVIEEEGTIIVATLVEVLMVIIFGVSTPIQF